MTAQDSASKSNNAADGGRILRLVGPLWRACYDPKFSTCNSAELSELDWKNWWPDSYQGQAYIHVRRFLWEEGETWHRVYPKNLRKRHCRRVAVKNGIPHWLLDRPND